MRCCARRRSASRHRLLATSGRASTTSRRLPSSRPRSCSSRRTRQASTSAIGATSKTGFGPRLASPERPFGSCSANASVRKASASGVRRGAPPSDRADRRRQRPAVAKPATRAVVGAGAWGTTLAVHLARRGPVVLLTRDEQHAAEMREARENKRHLADVALPDEIEVTADAAAVADATEVVVLAVPAAAMRDSALRIGPFVPDSAVLLSVAKGLEQGTLQRMTEV